MDENHVVEDHLVAVKTDGNIELHSISKTSEDFTSSCDAVVGKEQLKGLLHDRGKGNKNMYIILFIIHCSHHLSSHWLKAYS